jgi:hypothetical protein
MLDKILNFGKEQGISFITGFIVNIKNILLLTFFCSTCILSTVVAIKQAKIKELKNEIQNITKEKKKIQRQNIKIINDFNNKEKNTDIEFLKTCDLIKKNYDFALRKIDDLIKDFSKKEEYNKALLESNQSCEVKLKTCQDEKNLFVKTDFEIKNEIKNFK